MLWNLKPTKDNNGGCWQLFEWSPCYTKEAVHKMIRRENVTRKMHLANFLLLLYLFPSSQETRTTTSSGKRTPLRRRRMACEESNISSFDLSWLAGEERGFKRLRDYIRCALETTGVIIAWLDKRIAASPSLHRLTQRSPKNRMESTPLPWSLVSTLIHVYSSVSRSLPLSHWKWGH